MGAGLGKEGERRLRISYLLHAKFLDPASRDLTRKRLYLQSTSTQPTGLRTTARVQATAAQDLALPKQRPWHKAAPAPRRTKIPGSRNEQGGPGAH